jgi:hypothetical protein
MEERLARIREIIEQLRQMDSEGEIFGSERHLFRLGPPITPDKLAELEERYGVRLPEEYRQFLIHLGNGGCGPGYGLSRFGWMDSPHNVPRTALTGRTLTISSGPGFTITRPEMAYVDGTIADPWDLDFDDGLKILARDHTALKAPFPLTEPFQYYSDAGRVAEDAVPKDIDRGCFRLGTYGCGIDPLLIVTGPFAGQVWIDDRMNSVGVMPFYEYFAPYEETHHGGPLRKTGLHSFLDWYEDWLETSLVLMEMEDDEEEE